MPLRPERIGAAGLLESVRNRFAWRAEEARRQLRVRAPDGLVVTGDRLRLEQALGNLVDNALRHGEGKVTLASARHNGVVELHVLDEGAGIPPDLDGRAFERFVRGDHARSQRGAGLGLSIVQAIAEAHGGSAHVASRNGRGADVWLSLPA
jgi:signal transduction histidine kinase